MDEQFADRIDLTADEIQLILTTPGGFL